MSFELQVEPAFLVLVHFTCIIESDLDRKCFTFSQPLHSFDYLNLSYFACQKNNIQFRSKLGILTNSLGFQAVYLSFYDK